MPKFKDERLPTVRVNKELLEDIVKASKVVDETVSDYIRKAINVRNGKILKK